MKIRFYNDVHLGANNALMTFKEFMEDALIHWKNRPKDILLVYLGDNVDFANVAKKYIRKLEIFYVAILHYFDIFDIFITGNHERLKDSDRLETRIIEGKLVGFMHGDFIGWGKERSDEYRAKEHGAGFFKRNIWVNALEGAELFLDRTKSDKLKRKIEEFVLSTPTRLDVLFLAHFHPSENIIFDIKGTKVILLKRGIQTIEI